MLQTTACRTTKYVSSRHELRLVPFFDYSRLSENSRYCDCNIGYKVSELSLIILESAVAGGKHNRKQLQKQIMLSYFHYCIFLLVTLDFCFQILYYIQQEHMSLI